MITVVATASGLTLFGIGSAFWGLAFGLAVRAALRARARHVDGRGQRRPRRALR